MIHLLDIQISDAHTKIRRELRRLHLYQRCLTSFQAERKLYTESDPVLKKKIKNRAAETDLLSVFLNALQVEDNNKITDPQSQIINELNIRASLRIIPFVRSRLKNIEHNKQRLRSLRACEKKLLLQLEKCLLPFDLPKLNILDNYILKIADLRADMEELISARNLGEEIKKAIQDNIHQLLRAEKGGLPIDLENPQASGPLLEKLFSNAVTAEMYICAFNYEIREFSAGRDMSFHLEVLRDYKTTFFNHLILDSISETKIRLSLPYSRSFLNSLEVILRGIDARLGRLDNELSLTSVEKEAILARISREGKNQEPVPDPCNPELVNQ